jgi:uncharacterized membrane protein YkvA (DUF1232 family)
VKISGVQLEWSTTDIQAALVSYGGSWADQPEVYLEPGALRVRMKVTHDRLPVGLPVELRFTVEQCEGTRMILGVTWSNMGLVPGFLKEIALTRAFEEIPGRYENGKLYLELGEILDDLPATFQLEAVIIGSERVIVRLKDLAVALVPLSLSGAVDAPVSNLASAVLTAEAAGVSDGSGGLVLVPERPVEEHEGYYKEMRQRLQSFVTARVPAWVEPVIPWVLAVPDFFVMMVRLVRDPRIPTRSKILVGAVIAYFLSPFDVIPDVLGGLGLVDDLAVALFAVEELSKSVPANVLEEAWPGDGQVLEMASEGVRQMTQVLPGRTRIAILRVFRKR